MGGKKVYSLKGGYGIERPISITEEDKKKRNDRKGSKGFFVASLIIASLTFAFLTLAVIYLDSNGIIPENILKKFFFSTVVFVIIDGLLVFLSTRSKVAAIISIILCVAVILVSAFGTYLLYKYNESMREVEKDKTVYAYIGVYVKKDSRFASMSSETKSNRETNTISEDTLDEVRIGTMLINIDKGYTSQAIRMYRKEHKTTIITYDDFGSMVDALYKNEVDAIIFSEAYMDIFLDEETDYYEWALELERIAIETEHTAKVKQADVVAEPFIVYLSGIDTSNSSGLGTDEFPESARSDVNIVIAINPVKKKILLVNTPRDYYVPLWGKNYAMDKLTHAGVYGVGASISTIEELYDIEINYYVRTNFYSLVKVVDALGGITVHSDFDFYASTGTGEFRYFYVGENEIDGVEALCFVRERHFFENGDEQRGIHQQEVIKAIVNKACSPAIVAHFSDVLEVVINSVQTNIGREEINALIKMQLSDMASWTFESVSVDGYGAFKPSYAIGVELDPVWVMMPDYNTVSEVKERIKVFMSGE